MAPLCLLLCLAATPVDTAVVCPPAFQEALTPWLAHRQAQGHRIAVLPGGTAAEIRRGIRQLAAAGRLRAVVLVGDVDSGATDDLPSVPTVRLEAKVNVKWGSESHIGTDNWYADLDDDGIPDVAVGRLTCDTAAELSIMIGKILAYEQAMPRQPWPRRIHVVAGVGGFGALTDGILEMAARRLITEGIPAAYETTMTYANWRSPYCPDPRFFSQRTVDLLSGGSLFWVYIGHGQKTYLSYVQVPGSYYPILSTRDMTRLAAGEGAPIAVMLACYTGAFDFPRDCLAEEMLRAPGGPVAVYSGSRVTMPYAMAVMGVGLLDECFANRRETLGELILAAKQRMVKPAERSSRRVLLDTLARAISPDPELLAEERLEHVALFNLLGDPLLRLRHPRTVLLEAPPRVNPGESMVVRGKSPVGGTCTLELVCRRDRFTRRIVGRNKFDPSAAALAAYDQLYRQANDQRWHAQVVELAAGESFEATLPVPAAARGACHVRAYVTGQQEFAMGAADVQVVDADADRDVFGDE